MGKIRNFITGTGFVLILMLNSNRGYSLEFDYTVSLAKIFTGMIVSNEREPEFEFTALLTPFYFEEHITNLGFEISPLHYWNEDIGAEQKLSFINVKLFYNFLSKKPDEKVFPKVILGPYASLNWIALDNFKNWNINYPVFSAGLQVDFMLKTDFFGYNFVGMEIGYRNSAGKDCFFLSFQVTDPSALFAPFFFAIFPVPEKEYYKKKAPVPPGG